MTRILTFLVLIVSLSGAVFAQDATDPKTHKLLADAAKNGNDLHTEITVNGNVHAQAVLIPMVDAKRIFGKEIADNYAVIEVNVGNKSQDAALIIHGIFIDYREWPLSGSTPMEISGLVSTDKYQASSVPNEVASEEYRMVRGQLLDAQTDTLRNRFIRWLTLAGNLAGAFTFSINEQGIVKGIAAATGVGIPGVATAWPDKTIEQLNRISDLGFRSNKLIPKQGSDAIVCFFPIDRFLTPGFRKLFLKSPAIFFTPLSMLADKAESKDAEDALAELLSGSSLSTSDLRAGLPCFMKIRHNNAEAIGYDFCLSSFSLEKDPAHLGQLRTKLDPAHLGQPINIKGLETFLALEFVGNVSLNRVTVTIDGTMSVDVNTIAARVDEVDLDNVSDCGDASTKCFWTDMTANGGLRTGVIRGAYATGSTVALAEAAELNIDPITTIKDGSTDNELHFSFKLTRPIASQKKLHFTLTKPSPDTTASAKPLVSNDYEYLVDYPTNGVATNSINLAANNLTIKGQNFDPANLEVTLHSDTTEVKVPAASLTPAPTSNQITVAHLSAIPGVTPGCWYAQVRSGTLTSNHSDKFAINPIPTLDSATRNDSFIFVKGTDLIDLSHCDGPRITFRLNQDGAASIPLPVKDWNKGQPVLTLPEAAKTGTWIVEVLLDGNSMAANGTTQLKAPAP